MWVGGCVCELMYVCVCVCVKERERERERERRRERGRVEDDEKHIPEKVELARK